MNETAREGMAPAGVAESRTRRHRGKRWLDVLIPGLVFMVRGIGTIAKTLYWALPRGRKRSLRRHLWSVVMRDPDRRSQFLRLTSTAEDAKQAAGQATDTIVRDIYRAHGSYRQYQWNRVVDLLTPLLEGEQLGLDDFAILIRSLVAEGRLAECRRPFRKACAWARQRSGSAMVQAEVAALAIGLDDKDAALEFSERSESAWLAQYAAVVFGTGAPVVHEALRDRLCAGTGTPGAVTLALLDYGSPSERPVERNLGDYIQTLAVMRHVARFYATGRIRCGDGLDEVFSRLAESWRAEERIRPDRPLDVAVVDRDCARWRGEAWLPVFGWHGIDRRTGGVPMTFPLPAGLQPIFFSFHLNDIHQMTPGLCDYLKRFEPIGCRDRTTRDRLASAGVKAFFSGCITTTLALPEDEDPPAGGPRYQVNDAGGRIWGATRLTHDTGPAQRSFTERIAESLERLVLYKRAASVSTSRLHCYLPCRALGTPVTFNPENPADFRFDGLVDADEGELRRMADGLTDLMETTFRQILGGADQETVYRHWRDATMPLVERDEAERRDYAKLFAHRPSQGRVDAHATDPIPVTLAFDRNFVGYAPNLIRSVEANTSSRIRYHLLVRGLTAGDRENLGNACPEVAIEWHSMNEWFVDADDSGLLRHLTVSAMDRCLLPEVLPQVDKVLYLDMDTVVLGDVAELYGTPLGDRPLAAVPKYPLANWLEYSMSIDQGERVEGMRHLRAAGSVAGPLNALAFNSGVLVMSLETMRRDDFASQAQSNFKAFGYDDQTLLNLYACDYVKLDEAWNMDYRDYHANAEPAKIVHWTGPTKPWHGDGDVNDAVLRTKDLWERYSAA